MKKISKISDLVELILITSSGGAIGNIIYDIKPSILTGDLKKDPLVKQFFTLTADIINSNTSHDLMFDIFSRLEDFFLCIIEEYYSFEEYTFLQVISDFLEIFLAYCVEIPNNADYLFDRAGEFKPDYFELIQEGLEQIKIGISDEEIWTHSRNDDEPYYSVLNTYKIYEDQGYKKLFFQNHISQSYRDQALNDLLREHPIFNLRKDKLELRDLGINSIFDIKGFKTIGSLNCLDLSNNPISDLSGIENFPNLTVLKINNCNISKIDLLKNLTELRILELNNNKLIEITDLKILTKLEDLQIGGNKIREIDSIRNLVNLVKLNLRDNLISDLTGVGNLVRLRELDIRGNKINFSKNVDFLAGIENLSIDSFESYLSEEESQVLHNIENNGGIKFKTFDNLTIEENQVIHLKIRLTPSSIKYVARIIEETKKLKQIKKFEFSLENLSTFPEDICEINTLEELVLSENKFTSLPDSILNMKQLKKVDLSYNRLTSLPLALVKLDSLEFLDLSYNRIKQLPKAIGNFKSLKTLILQGNELVEIPKSIKNIDSLEKVNLKGNDFTSEPEPIGKLRDKGIEVLITYI
ncbi:MAG: leucine-rich repeat domain-containing protein [Promethearchaeota archaeon]|jgi:Leucine-rich repeat (LRR) protein